MFETAIKKRAIRAYRRKLGPKLRERFGRKRYYTPYQVRDAAKETRCSPDYLCYAYAMYCDRTEFDAFHAARGEQCDYDTMRDAVSLYEFDGNSSFNLSMDSDTGNSSAESGWFGSFGGDGDSGLGGDDGGDGGGSD